MIVLDTNVVSEAMSLKPNGDVLTWLNRQSADSLYLSSVSLAELLFGIGAMPTGARRDRLEVALDTLLTLFSGRVLSFDERSARYFATMAVAARAAGRPLAHSDGYIAASAISRGFAIATRNVKDFLVTGVEVLNPWELR